MSEPRHPLQLAFEQAVREAHANPDAHPGRDLARIHTALAALVAKHFQLLIALGEASAEHPTLEASLSDLLPFFDDFVDWAVRHPLPVDVDVRLLALLGVLTEDAIASTHH